MTSAVADSRRVLRAMLSATGAGWRWWTSQLADMLPRRLSGRAAAAVTITVGPDGALTGLADPTGIGTAIPSSQASGKTVPAILRLPSDLVLARTVTVAAAAEENLAEVIAFQLDRFTPFEPDEIYLGCRIVGRDPDAEAITVAMAVAPRVDVDALIAGMTRRGLACTGVTVPPNAWLPGQGLPDLPLEIERATMDINSFGRATRLSVLLAAALAAACVAVPLLRGRSQLAETGRELAAMRTQALVVARLRDEVEQRAEQAGIPGERAKRTPLSIILTELTRLVPDESWVTQLEIDAGSVQLTGYAVAANALIPALEGSPILTNAAFRSPVTQDAVHKVEQFHLSVDLRNRSE